MGDNYVKYIKYTDLMDIYGITRSTIDRWRKEGLPCVKIGRGVRFVESEVRKWVTNNKEKPK